MYCALRDRDVPNNGDVTGYKLFRLIRVKPDGGARIAGYCMFGTRLTRTFPQLNVVTVGVETIAVAFKVQPFRTRIYNHHKWQIRRANIESKPSTRRPTRSDRHQPRNDDIAPRKNQATKGIQNLPSRGWLTN